MTDPSKLYGGSILAMKGKNAIVMVGDRRLGYNLSTVNNNFTKIFPLTPQVVIGLTSFVPDCQMVLKQLKKHINMFSLTQNREIEPEEVCSLLSYILYSKRFSPYYISPIVIGFNRKGEPKMFTMDLIGCVDSPESYTSAGTASINLTGVSEVLFEENMEDEELFTTAVQAFLNAVDRDALSGWGADAVILTPTKRIHRTIKGRQD